MQSVTIQFEYETRILTAEGIQEMENESGWSLVSASVLDPDKHEQFIKWVCLVRRPIVRNTLTLDAIREMKRSHSDEQS